MTSKVELFLGEPTLSFSSCSNVASVYIRSRIVLLRSIRFLPGPPNKQVSLTEIADTRHGAYGGPGSCTQGFRDTSQFQPQDDPRNEVQSLIPSSDREPEQRSGFPGMPGQQLPCEESRARLLTARAGGSSYSCRVL